VSREVAIIGCGPAGLLAAHAAVLADYHPVIYSLRAERSPIPPAVMIHAAIPEVSESEPDARVMFTKLGDGHGYAAKVYGDPEHPTSWEKFTDGSRAAWALAPIYGRLWHLYRDLVKECEITPARARGLQREFATVINTAPLPSLCEGGHTFPSRPIWIKDHAPRWLPRDTMVYNGDERYDWYRASDFFGVRSTEYATPMAGARKGVKVQPTSCDCHPGMVRAGRWGTWQPGVLLHHAFDVALNYLSVERTLTEGS